MGVGSTPICIRRLVTLKFYKCACTTPHLHKISNLTKKIASAGQFTFDYKILKRYMIRKIVKQGIIWVSNMQIRYFKDLCKPCLNAPEKSPKFFSDPMHHRVVAYKNHLANSHLPGKSNRIFHPNISWGHEELHIVLAQLEEPLAAVSIIDSIKS